MEICNRNHEEIVHLDGDCPLCSALDEIIGLNDEIETLTNEIEET